MGKSSPSAPAAPDPTKTATAQTASNKETAYWNAVMGNMNQTTPYGSITYTDSSNGHYDPNNAPKFSSTITLNPEQQKLLDTQNRSNNALASLGEDQISRIRDSVSTPYSYAGLPGAMTAEDVNAASLRGENAIRSRLDPQFARDEEALRTRLINQGIGQGSDAYNAEFDTFNKAKNDAYMQAILGGDQYGADLQNQAIQRRNQAIQEYNAVRNAPLNEYTALTSGQQIQNPNFSGPSPGNAQSGDIQGATQEAYKNALGMYNSKVASNNANQSALFGLGGSLFGAGTGAGSFLGSLGGLFGFSDERLKDNIIHVGVENGHNIYEFSYKGNDRRFVGVMAQEVEKTHPEAVHMVDGYRIVNYPAIGVKMREVG